MRLSLSRALDFGLAEAIKLVTGGRIGSALDSKVRDHLDVGEPVTAEQWIEVLKSDVEDELLCASIVQRGIVRLKTTPRGRKSPGMTERSQLVIPDVEQVAT